MSTFTVNNKEYEAKAFDFNLICDLEDMGLSLREIGDKTMSFVRAYFGLCAEIGKESAGKEMEAHIISGGTFDGITEVMSDEMKKSDFFRSINKTEETDSTTSTPEKTEKKSE